MVVLDAVEDETLVKGKGCAVSPVETVVEHFLRRNSIDIMPQSDAP
jgi:hypothetical protein